jgi:peptide/nickel transport system ATP-binding protein
MSGHLGSPDKAAPLLAVDDLRVAFATDAGMVKAVDGMSLTLGAGETLAVVGESGCGKSVTAMSIMRLIDAGAARTSGSIRLEGADLLALDERQMRHVRGKRIAMIFQEPLTSLNPVMTIGRQITESIRLHDRLGAAAAKERAVAMLALVRLADPKRHMSAYPHQLSGGMRQRVMIALALACSPSVLVADEPTTALDVTVQAQILDLLLDLRQRLGMAILLITHDLGVVAGFCDRVVVMYAGRKVEEAPVEELFERPLHPYTRGLMRCIPRLGRGEGDLRLAEIPGTVPAGVNMPSGCTFAPRCALAIEPCRRAFPDWRELRPGHGVACWRAEETVAEPVHDG